MILHCFKRRRWSNHALRVSPAVTRLTVYRRLQVLYMLVRVIRGRGAASWPIRGKWQICWKFLKFRFFSKNTIKFIKSSKRPGVSRHEYFVLLAAGGRPSTWSPPGRLVEHDNQRPTNDWPTTDRQPIDDRSTTDWGITHDRPTTDRPTTDRRPTDERPNDDQNCWKNDAK